MLTWFQQNAPIRRKLTIAFGSMSLLSILSLVAGWAAIGHVGASAALGNPDLARKALHTVETGFGAVSALLIGSSLLMGYVYRRAIANPYVTTVVRMEGLAAGDLDSPIQFTAYKDCVGRMTGAMFSFRKNALDKIESEARAVELKQRTEKERKEAEDAAIASQTALIVDSIGTGLERLAAGDLTFRLTEALPQAYEKLRENFNAALTQLHETMEIIVSNAASLKSGTDEISQAADDLSRRTEQQAANLEETAAALDEITATVSKTASGANNARDTVATAKTDAEHSGEVVRQAVSAMSEIEKSAQQISQIIGVIDEIAFQTNLLALNAGVEAARAGDAGRGFAVVASEVRALAQRSAEAAKEIKTLISTSTQQVSRGVQLVDETGRSLIRIVAQVAEINTIVTEIAASAQEQSTGLHQVNGAINQMDQMTQQNAAMVEQSTAASHTLARDTDNLVHLTEGFQLEQEQQRPVRRTVQSHAPVKLVARRAPIQAPAKPPARQGRTAVALKPMSQQETWEEF